jgi:hypothetical protein
MLKGIGDNALAPLTLDLAGPANGKKGFYDWDYNNFGPRIAAAWSPHARGGFLGWLTGGDRMVVRGGEHVAAGTVRPFPICLASIRLLDGAHRFRGATRRFGSCWLAFGSPFHLSLDGLRSPASRPRRTRADPRRPGLPFLPRVHSRGYGHLKDLQQSIAVGKPGARGISHTFGRKGTCTACASRAPAGQHALELRRALVQ